MNKKYLITVTKEDVEKAISYLEDNNFSISESRKLQFINSWNEIEGLYGDCFSKTICAVVDGHEVPDGYEYTLLID